MVPGILFTRLFKMVYWCLFSSDLGRLLWIEVFALDFDVIHGFFFFFFEKEDSFSFACSLCLLVSGKLALRLSYSIGPSTANEAERSSEEFFCAFCCFFMCGFYLFIYLL